MWASHAVLEIWGSFTLAVAMDCVTPPVWRHDVDSYVKVSDFSTSLSFRKQYVVVPVSMTSTKLVF